MAIKDKTVLEILDFVFDLKQTTNGGNVPDWLYASEVISSGYSVSVDSDITVVSTGLLNSSTTVRVRISGGVAGKSYYLNVSGSTNQFRTFDFTMMIKIVDKRFINAN